MLNLKVITASTRPGRKGPALSSWIIDVAQKHGSFDVELLDLGVINLPFLDEPHHPRLQKYEHEHTINWSNKIAPADAFIIVTSEYNYGYPAPLKNALDYLYNEWTFKPVAFVSYGGISGGTRCVQQLKQVVTAQKMMPIVEIVNIPFFTKYIDDTEKFIPDEGIQKSADAMFAELLKWANALKPLREK